MRVVEFIADYDGVCAMGNIRPMRGVFTAICSHSQVIAAGTHCSLYV